LPTSAKSTWPAPHFWFSSTKAGPGNGLSCEFWRVSSELNVGLKALQQRLQHPFSNPSLLTQAVTHRSFSADHNERLEFLGDSVLNLAVADLLYQKLSDLPEGDLSRVRANLVKQDTLHQLSVALGLPDVIRLGEGEVRSGGQKRPSILADALEAVIGAVYLDGGAVAAHALVMRLFKDVEINPTMDAIGKDPKTGLQEWLQGRKMKLPAYKVVAILGVAHKQTFDVECEIAEWRLAERGIGGSRRAAEQAAASAMLQTLTKKYPT
jgi:ribonuclease-3